MKIEELKSDLSDVEATIHPAITSSVRARRETAVRNLRDALKELDDLRRVVADIGNDPDLYKVGHEEFRQIQEKVRKVDPTYLAFIKAAITR